jgi:hypothetical protein
MWETTVQASPTSKTATTPDFLPSRNTFTSFATYYETAIGILCSAT